MERYREGDTGRHGRGDTRGATQAWRHRLGDTGRHRLGDTRGANTWLGDGTAADLSPVAGESSARRPRANVRSAPGSR
jgi:hypothetical protein